jgi:predicted amidophosphoribosyltransferase
VSTNYIQVHDPATDGNPSCHVCGAAMVAVPPNWFCQSCGVTTQPETLALEDFEREYEGTVCAVCQSEKWPNSPFCRSCSIKLQRARLMQRMKDTMDSHGRRVAEVAAFQPTLFLAAL